MRTRYKDIIDIANSPISRRHVRVMQHVLIFHQDDNLISVLCHLCWGYNDVWSKKKQPSWISPLQCVSHHGLLARYVKLRVAHAPGMPRTFFPPLRVSDPDMHHGTCVTHVPWCMPGSLTDGFLWSRWRGKRSQRMRNPQFYVSGKRPMVIIKIVNPLRPRDACI